MPRWLQKRPVSSQKRFCLGACVFFPLSSPHTHVSLYLANPTKPPFWAFILTQSTLFSPCPFCDSSRILGRPDWRIATLSVTITLTTDSSLYPGRCPSPRHRLGRRYLDLPWANNKQSPRNSQRHPHTTRNTSRARYLLSSDTGTTIATYAT